ncbi:MAG: chitobiase/beta-hexosaminidase C-terminal domain-containing protein, partial [Lachnospiraceae bacterium]|nr:chitobiase/beta-hexosaminidase C-terminal domain-containing protein [Lachnospiraceae bacterium]
FTYTVAEHAPTKQLPKPTISPASKEVQNGDEGTVTITKAADNPDGTEIYYTTDGKHPSKTNGQFYTKPFTLTVNEMTTVKAIAAKDGEISSVAASVTYTVKNNDQTGQKEDGIYIAGLEKQYYYTGAKIIPDIEVWTYTGGVGTLLEQGVDYTVTYKNNVKPTDAAEVIVKGKGNYKGKSESKTFKIVQEDKITTGLENLKGAKIKDKIDPQVYTGEAILPDFTLTLKDNTTITYTKNTDSSSKSLYKRSDGGAMNVNVAVSNNINKGTATILVTGDNDSKGNPTSVKKTFKITPVDISSATVTPTAGTYAVNGAAPASLKVTINLNGKTVELKKGKDYTVKYSNNKKAGKATVTVTGKGNYTKKCSPEEYAVNKLDLSTLKVDAVTACKGIKVGKVKATIVDQKGNVIALKPTQYELEIYKVVEADGGTKTKGAKYEDSAEQLGAEFIYVAAKAKDEDNLEQSTVTPEAEFKVGIDISKAKFKLKKGVVKEYTGSAVTLDGSEFDNPTIKDDVAEVPLVAGT